MQRPVLLFSSQLDRAAIAAYFLGAIVPLLGFAFVVQRYTFPQTEAGIDSAAWIGLLVFTAFLSLGSFLVLRSRISQMLDRKDLDNRQLGSLVRAASELASIEHLSQAGEPTVRAAQELTGASAAYWFLHETPPDKLTLASATGDPNGNRYGELESSLVPMVRLALEENRPVTQSPPENNAGNEFGAIIAPLPGDSTPIGALVALCEESDSAALAGKTHALTTLAALASVAIRNGDLRDAQTNFFSHVTEILVNALDVHLGFHHGHGKRVAALVNPIGRLLDFTPEAMQRLHFSALLHDLGMLKLDRNQQMNRSTCERHTTLGGRLLGRIRLWKEIAPAVEHHHEWYDGSGYPAGLAGDEIPIEARIISVCDAYDTMTSTDSYREARMPSEAMAELEACAGTQFDPAMVEKFREAMENNALPTESPNSDSVPSAVATEPPAGD